jgi:tetratricopeptide (TPR) repeat protein
MAQPRSPFHPWRILLPILLIATVWPSHVCAQDSYRRLLDGYRNYDETAARELGDFWEALERRGTNGTDPLMRSVPPAQAPLSVMALTDLGLAALARGDREVGNRHLEVAQRWVDQLLASNADPSTPLHRFARKWYLAVIWVRFARAEGSDASKLLDVARAKFPADPEVLLSSGTFEAMEITRDRVERGGGRHRADRDSRVNSYGLSAPQVQVIRASGYFREAIKLDPNNAEARLRLAWLRFTTQSLDFSGELTLLKEARTLAPKPPLSYLAALFAGRIEEELKHLDAAALWYRTAIAECPAAQTARLGLSHIQLDQHEIVASRNTLRPLIGRPAKEDYVCEPDPWRVYEFGQSWRLTDWIVAMRKEVREPAEGSQP